MSQEILSIAGGELNSISAAHYAHSKPVYAGMMFANNFDAGLVENRRPQVRCCLRTTQVQSEPYTLTKWQLVPLVSCDGNCMISSIVLSRNVHFSLQSSFSANKQRKMSKMLVGHWEASIHIEVY